VLDTIEGDAEGAVVLVESGEGSTAIDCAAE